MLILDICLIEQLRLCDERLVLASQGLLVLCRLPQVHA